MITTNEMIKMPKISWDFSINLGHILSIVAFVLSAIGVWYNVQARLDKTEYRIEILERQQLEQDATRDRINKEIRDSIRESNGDVKQEIRDLRNDLIRKQTH